MGHADLPHLRAPIRDALTYIDAKGGSVDRAGLPPGLSNGVELCVTDGTPLLAERDIGPRPAGPVPALGQCQLCRLRPGDRFEFFAGGTDRHEVVRLVGPSMGGGFAVETPAGRLAFDGPHGFTPDATLDPRSRVVYSPRGQFGGGGAFLPPDLAVWRYAGPMPEFAGVTLVELTDAGRIWLRRDAATAAAPGAVARLAPPVPTGMQFPKDGAGVPAEYRDHGDLLGDVLTVEYMRGDPYNLTQSTISKNYSDDGTKALTTYVLVGPKARAYLHSEIRALRVAKTDRTR